MSGTSLDGISTALVRLDDGGAELVAFRQEPYSTAERGSIIDTMARGTPKDVAFLHVALGERFAGAVLALLAQARVAPKDLSFIASHGQTIWHEPGRATFQLGDASVLAERVGVRVVSDFRARDVAAGGQGAPLVPLADVMLFGHEQRGRWLLNIGGMANVRWVPGRGVPGGGAKNPALIERLVARVQPRPVVLFDQLFFNGEAKEAVAFAFLGHQTVLGRPGNLPAATGARGRAFWGISRPHDRRFQ